MKLQDALRGVVMAASLVGLAVTPLPASASITGTGINDLIPIRGTDDFLSTGFGMPGVTPAVPQAYGLYAGVLTGAAGWYQIDIYGAEASFTNALQWNDGTGWATLYTNPGGGSTFLPGTPNPTPPPPLQPVPIVPSLLVYNPTDGVLPFRFVIGDGTIPPIIVENGSNPDDPNRPGGQGGGPSPANFVLFTNPAVPLGPAGTNYTGSSPFWFVNLDDGNAVDDDDDDLNFRITKIPTPGAILLFGVGLVGLGLTRRRRATAA